MKTFKLRNTKRFEFTKFEANKFCFPWLLLSQRKGRDNAVSLALFNEAYKSTLSYYESFVCLWDFKSLSRYIAVSTFFNSHASFKAKCGSLLLMCVDILHLRALSKSHCFFSPPKEVINHVFSLIPYAIVPQR